ncbi:MAG: protecting protein DprA [Marmoricola sp.]|nr:protecting protein DprA [Marmoricola sp.]
MSTPVDERRARLVLSVVGEPGDPRLTSLVDELGAVEVLAALREQGTRGEQGTQGEIGGALAERLRAARPEDVLAAAQQRGIRFVVPGEAEWPDPLDDLAHVAPLHARGGVPVGLWLRGPLRLDEVAAGAVAVVGARSATSYGARVAGEIGAAVAQADRAVVSGAAFGIDQAAHRGALAVRGRTVAVLACGVDRSYPAAHSALLEHIGDHGLLVSEAAPGCAPTKIRFLSRNRLIAGLSRGVVVVEAAVRSGALNTANWADGLGRSLMGVPGPVTSAASQGVHQLIRTRNALLVADGADVLESVGESGQHLPVQRRGPVRAYDLLTDDQQQVLDAVPVLRPAPTRSVARAAGLPVAVVAAALADLLGAGMVLVDGDSWRVRPGAPGATAVPTPGLTCGPAAAPPGPVAPSS